MKAITKSGADAFALGEAQACAQAAEATELNCDPSTCGFWFDEATCSS